ncbi:MAG: PD40 domain-containing protein [Thermoleophilaceae bacterium]|nr:PD40 domain-containing protein [Thermoleophilaceae bacterium]
MKRLLLSLVLLAATAGCSLGQAGPASDLTETTATLNADIGSNQGGEVTYWFRYGTTTDYGTVTPDRTLDFPEGHIVSDPMIPVSEPVTGLEPNTTYHFQVCTSPGIEPGSRGCTPQDHTFTTGPFPEIAFSSARGDEAESEIYVMDADGGAPTNVSNHPASDYEPVWSPDRSRIAFTSNRSGNLDVWVMDADGGNPANLTENEAWDGEPAWSPDGTKIAFMSFRDGNDNTEVYVMDADGGNQTNLSNSEDSDSSPAWSPDGSKIAFTSSRDGNQDIFVMDADGTDPVNLSNHALASHNLIPAWSPDGTKIAFTATRDGNWEVYVMDADDGGNQTNLTNDPGLDFWPVWSPDGTKIAFATDRGTDREIYVMDADDGDNQTNLTEDPAFDNEPSWAIGG